MIQDMKTILTRMFTVVVLMMISMAAGADVKVLYGEKGTDKFEGEGGSIKIEQTDSKDVKIKVTVYLTFIPDTDKGFVFDESTLEVYAVVSPRSASTRAPEISGDPLKLTEEKTDVSSAKRYSVNIDPNLALWVKKAEFLNSRKEGEEYETEPEPEPVGYDFSGEYFIANHNRGAYYPDDHTKNYYLCPSTKMYDTNQPLLTTYKERTSSTPYPQNSKWTVKFAKTESGVDYYFLIHSSEKYLTWNEQLVSNNADRVRVHLQSTLLDVNESDYQLFYFVEGNQGTDDYNICPKAWTNRNKGASLNPAKYNNDQYYGEGNKGNGDPGAFSSHVDSGPCGGLVGVYDLNDPPGVWYFEEQIKRPTIVYNTSNLIEITAPTGATIRYTTNGTKPSATNGTEVNTNTVTFDPDDNVTIIKAVAIVNGEVSNVVTFKPTVLLGSNHPRLIKTKQSQYYYLIPSEKDNANNTTLSVLNVPCNTMTWYFENAGVTDGVQYYFIRNSQGGYAYHDGVANKANIYLKNSKEDSDNYKFSIVGSSESGYNLMAKGNTTNPVNYYDAIATGTNPSGIKLAGTKTDVSSSWNIVPYNNYILSADYFDNYASTDADTKYVQINNVTATTKYFVPSTPMTIKTLDTSDDRKSMWIVKKVGTDADGLLNYYTFQNDLTQEYLCYVGETECPRNSGNALKMSTLANAEDEDLLQFVIVPALDAGYNIIPKTIVDKTRACDGESSTKKSYNCFNMFQNKDVIGLYYDKSGGSRWNFTVSDLVVTPPLITYDETTKKVVITCTTAGATIKYTTGLAYAADPTTGTDYTDGDEGFGLGSNFVVRAVAVKGTNTSDEATPLNLFASTSAKEHPFLIQNKEQSWYYIIPCEASTSGNDNGYVKAITTSLNRPTMMWCFEPAETVEGKQYYYIVNKETNEYFYYHSVSTNYYISLMSATDFTAAEDKDPYKFSIETNSNGGNNIIPKSAQTNYVVKNSYNNGNSYLVAPTWGKNDVRGLWYFVPVFDEKMPVTTSPVTASEGDDILYYEISSEAADTYFIVAPTSPATAVTTTEEKCQKTTWYFKEADHDDWLTYYNIVNAVTGEYLYILSDGTYAMGTSPTGDDAYQFALAKAAKANQADPELYVYPYFIIPKSKKYDKKREYTSIWRDGTNPLKTKSGRYWKDNSGEDKGNDNVIKWFITATVLRCDKPTITYDEDADGYVITPAQEGDKIYYTIDKTTPTASPAHNLYSGAIPMSQLGKDDVIKAIAAKDGDPAENWSEVAEFPIPQVKTPEITDNGNNAIEITCATEGATIYYTTNGNTPTTESAVYSEPLTDVAGKNVKAIAVKGGYANSEVQESGVVMFACATPVIKKTGQNSFTITCSNPAEGATIYYTTDGTTEPTISSPLHITSGEEVADVTFPLTIKAIATATNYTPSAVAVKEILEGLGGSGSADDPYLIESDIDFALFVTMVNDNGTTTSDYTDCATMYYELTKDISVSGLGSITTVFAGTFDGGMHTISNLGHALFDKVNDGKVKNVILDKVSISSGTNNSVGAIASEATGSARIYNCGVLGEITETKDQHGNITAVSGTSEISGSGSDNVGSLVGLLDGEARVINCYSYAVITGGNLVGGIVGKNNVATTSSNLKTMVMNCMFYGDITGGTNKAPIYNGTEISNEGNTGVGNYNYFRAEAKYVQDNAINTYNCALLAETRFLQRFEFFRNLLNSHLELAGWWATGSYDKSQMKKWVMEPSQIGSATPYPILKEPGKYPSVVNIDVNLSEPGKVIGTKLGELTVNVQMGSGGAQFGPPTGAAIKEDKKTLTLSITDKDPGHYNFNYYKVQLPYYNDVGTKNYRKADDGTSRVVTGWKVSVSGGTNSYTTGTDVTFDANGNITKTPYNFADRNSTEKDSYSKTGRIFNQGAYFDVPEGVSSITIEPYWAKAAYVTDANADVVYSSDMKTAKPVANVGGGAIYTSGGTKRINGEDQTVYTSIANAVSALSISSSNKVYDYAVVLVGNYHQYNGIPSDNIPYTVTTIDEDGDNEPDYSFMLRFDNRTKFHPVRYDFLNLVGLGMAQKSTSGKATYNFGIPQPKYWFETTNTALFRVTQFEYDCKDRAAQPIILHGGVMEQWVSGQNEGIKNNILYFHVGGNVWFKEFHLGCHQDRTDRTTKHLPVSVSGGDYDEFYLTGLYAAKTGNFNDNAECYINGGRFGIVAGTGMEGIGDATTHTNGSITWQIDHADITEFYGGGTNAAKPAEGNITTVISNSHVDVFCGGPKFGDMNSGRTVKTTATNCTFGKYFGAGYGGSSYNRQAPFNATTVQYNIEWNKWVNGEITFGTAGNNQNFNGYHQEYKSAFDGVSTQIAYQFLPMSDNSSNVARLWIEYVKFSLATTRNVTSKLTGCTIEENFYGGGSLGKVDGPVTSILTNCTVKGNVFGAGYSASLPEVPVMNTGGFFTEPNYNEKLGVYMSAVMPDTLHYTWKPATVTTITQTSQAIDTDKKELYTTVDISPSNLGSVSGQVTLTITTSGNDGRTVIGTEGNSMTGHVYGGGDESYVINTTTPTIASTTVNIKGNTEVKGNVFGGGNRGEVSGNTTVNIEYEEPTNP